MSKKRKKHKKFDRAKFEAYAADIMANFDFEKVHRAMVALDWTWTRIRGTPDVEELKATARKLLEEEIDYLEQQRSRVQTGTGGFHVQGHVKHGGWLSLHFYVTEWDSPCE